MRINIGNQWMRSLTIRRRNKRWRPSSGSSFLKCLVLGWERHFPRNKRLLSEDVERQHLHSPTICSSRAIRTTMYHDSLLFSNLNQNKYLNTRRNSFSTVLITNVTQKQRKLLSFVLLQSSKNVTQWLPGLSGGVHF